MSRKSAPWFKCYPEDWLDDTRHLGPVERALYFDVLCLIYKTDDQLSDDDVWIAHKLHVKVRVWKPVKETLIAAKKIVVQNGLITNSRASREVLARSSARSAKSVAATEREAKKRDTSETGNENKDSEPHPCSSCGKEPCRCLPDNGHHARVVRARASESRSQTVDRDNSLGLSPINKNTDSIFAEGAGDRLIPFSSTDGASILEIGKVAAFRQKHGSGDDKRLPFTASVLRQIALLGVDLESLVTRYFKKTKGTHIKDPSAYLITMAHEEAAKAFGVSVEVMKAITTGDLQDSANAMAEAVGAGRQQPEWMKRLQVNRDRSALANTSFIRSVA